MCYSAQVTQMARKLSRRLGIRLDYDEVEKLFFRRLDDPGLIISRGFEVNFHDPAKDQEWRIDCGQFAMSIFYDPFVRYHLCAGVGKRLPSTVHACGYACGAVLDACFRIVRGLCAASGRS